MKKYFFAVLCLTLGFSIAQAQEQSLGGEVWRLTTGDSAVYATPEYNDAAWRQVSVPAYWEETFPNYDGFGWYRVTFSLAAELAKADTLALLLGKVDDIDETFFNGEKIGQTGSFNPPESHWKDDRIYFIPKRLFRTGANVLAVRVLDTGGGGGLYAGDLKLTLKKNIVVRIATPDMPHRSIQAVPFVSGDTVRVYDLRKQSVVQLLPQRFKAYTENSLVPNLASAKSISKTPLPDEQLAAQVDANGKFETAKKIQTVISNDAVRNVYARQTAWLRLAQISSNGQLLASLPPGEWNISWARDASYAIVAAAKNEQYDVAKRGLEFMLTAKSNHYKTFIWKDPSKHDSKPQDYGIGKDYQISVCRYFGGGEEESDSDASGPNIELDGFGLFLWAMETYIAESDDKAFLKKHWNVCRDKIADVILHCIDGRNGLLRKDSGIWERHLPGKQYTYTSIACFQGLKSVAALAEKMNDKKSASTYKREAERLRQAILKTCVDDESVLKGNAEATSKTEREYYDAAVVEAVNFGVLNVATHAAERAIAIATLKKFDDVLKLKTTSPDAKREGWYRCSNGDWYDSQEWVFLDLRIASAYLKLGEAKRAGKILDWVTAQTEQNLGIISELYTVGEADYAGAYPMIGFGAGAYLLTVQDFYITPKK
jgi:hypothetical protein